MRVMVSEIDGGHASTPQASARLFALLGPALARGEEVVLDFDGVKHCSAPFLMETVGRLVEADADGRVAPLLRCVNLRPLWQDSLDWVVEKATRRRENPAWANAWDEAYSKHFGGED